MIITKKQLAKIIKEEIALVREGADDLAMRPPGAGADDLAMRLAGAAAPASAQEWKMWAEPFGLSSEYDNDGQLIFYLSAEQPDRAKVAAEAVKAGAQVDTDQDGNDMIYTGMTDAGPLWDEEELTIAQEGTTAPSGEQRGQGEGQAVEFARALYAIEDNVEQYLYGTELEPLVKQLTDAIKTKLGREDLTSGQS